MTAPNFSRGVPPVPLISGKGESKWTAKYDGACNYCGAEIREGETLVKWNADNTGVICGSHITTTRGTVG